MEDPAVFMFVVFSSESHVKTKQANTSHFIYS